MSSTIVVTKPTGPPASNDIELHHVYKTAEDVRAHRTPDGSLVLRIRYPAIHEEIVFPPGSNGRWGPADTLVREIFELREVKHRDD